MKSEKVVEEVINKTEEEINTRRRKVAAGRQFFLSMHKSKLFTTADATVIRHLDHSEGIGWMNYPNLVFLF